MHTSVDARWCCKFAPPPPRLELVCRRWFSPALAGTLHGPVPVELAAPSSARESPNAPALGMAETEAPEPEASAPMPLVQELPVPAPTPRKCFCGGSQILS